MEEEELLERLNTITDYMRSSEDVEESDLEILFTFFKEYVKCVGDKFTCPIYRTVNKDGKGKKSLSSNNIQNFDMKEFLSTVAHQNQQNTPECIRQLLENIELEEEILKIMVISNQQATKSEVLAKFIMDDAALDPPQRYIILNPSFEIRKKVISLYERTVRLEFFDTDLEFHKLQTSYSNYFFNTVYYKLCNAFFVICDLNDKGSHSFLQEIYDRVENCSTCMFCAICLNYTLDNKDVKKFCEDNKIVFFPITFESFNESDEHLQVLFTWILIRKIKKETSNKSIDSHNERTLDKCGYKKEYQLNNKKVCQKKKKYSL
jgi:hypothetical protein